MNLAEMSFVELFHGTYVHNRRVRVLSDLLTGLIPAQLHTREEAAARVFPELRRREFYRWVNQIASASGVRVEVDPERVARLLEGGAP